MQPDTATHDTSRSSHGQACGICGADVPPLIGRVLTGTGLTLDQAAHVLLDDGALPPALTPIQRRLVEEHATTLGA